jgi:hypothetical protein
METLVAMNGAETILQSPLLTSSTSQTEADQHHQHHQVQLQETTLMDPLALTNLTMTVAATATSATGHGLQTTQLNGPLKMPSADAKLENNI